MQEMRDAIKKIADLEAKLAKLDAFMKRLIACEEGLKQKADKTDIFRLDTEKADKSIVETDIN